MGDELMPMAADAPPAPAALPPPAPINPAPVGANGVAQYANASADSVTAANDETAALANANALGTGASVAKADGLDAKAMLQQQQADELERVASERQRHIADAEKQADDIEREAKDFKFHNHWAEQTTGRRMIAGLGVIFGNLGGGRNEALDYINNGITRDFDAQKAQLTSRENIAKLRREHVKDLQSALQNELSEMHVRQGVALNALADKGEAMLIRRGIPAEQAKQDVDVQKLRVAAADKKLEGVKGLAEMKQKQAQLALTYAQAAKDRAAPGQAREDAANARADAAKLKADAELEKLVVNDTQGNPIGLTGSAKAKDKIAVDQAATESYVDKARAVIADIKVNGHILNPLSEAGRRRSSMVADLQSAGRSASGIQASDAGAHLESEMIGGSGVGLNRTASPRALEELLDKAIQKNDMRLRATLRPLPKDYAGGQMQLPGDKAAPAPAPAAPSIPAGAKLVGKTKSGADAYRLPNGKLWTP